MNVCIYIFFSYLWSLKLLLNMPMNMILLFIVAFTDCPGPQSESAGKSDACEGCPNQQICATVPKGPDPGTLHL